MHETRPPKPGFRFGPPQAATGAAAPAELKPGQKREEIEGVFLMQRRQGDVRDRSSSASPASAISKCSTGLKEGDRVITGPFDSVRGMYEGDMVKTRRSRPAPRRTRQRRSIAHRSIVDVADPRVGSAGAGVDLGQQAPVDADAARQHRRGVVDHHGRRADHRRERARSPTRSSSDLGADSFTIQRMGITQNEDDFERMRNNPHRDDGRCRRRSSGLRPRSASVMAQAQTQTRVAYRDEELETVQVQGVSEEYLDFTTFDAERGRMITPDRNQAQAAGGADRLADRRPAVRRADPLDKQIRIAGVPFRVVGVSARRRAPSFGNSLDEFVVIPLGAYQKLFGARQSLALMVKPRDADAGQQRERRGARRAARRSRR